MRNEFIATQNVQAFNEICEELEDIDSMIGPSMAMATGPAGRGKTEAARYYAVHSIAVYIPPFLKRTAAMLLRDISFELCGARPNRIETCLNTIRDEMGKSRRLIIVDEADLIPMSLLEMLRNINELCACPVMLIGEDRLKGKVGSETRLRDRIRRRMEFAPISASDVGVFFQRSVGVRISSDVCNAVHHYAGGTWRRVLKLAAAAERAMFASGLKEISHQMAKELIGNLQKDETK